MFKVALEGAFVSLHAEPVTGIRLRQRIFLKREFSLDHSLVLTDQREVFEGLPDAVHSPIPDALLLRGGLSLLGVHRVVFVLLHKLN